MVSYKELQAKIADLQAQAEEARRIEIKSAVDQIKALVAEFGLTAIDLGLDRQTKKAAGLKVKSPAKYRDSSGNEWSGRGRMPAWLKGKDKTKYLAE